MRFVFLLSFILLSSCESKRNSIIRRQETIKKKMDEVKAFYYNKLDSLENIKKSDTNSIKQNEVAGAINSMDGKRSMEMLTLQNEFDSLEVELNK